MWAQTPGQLAASKKYQQEKLDEIKFRVPKGNKERIQEHARSQGESTNAFIYHAVNETIERDQAKNKTHFRQHHALRKWVYYIYFAIL